MSAQKILVVGATGNVGSEVVRILREQGHVVRGTTSQRERVRKNGDGELVHLDLVTGEGIREAFEGVDRLFLFSPPGFADQYRILAPLIREAGRKNLKKVVLMTAMGANADEKSPLRRAEVDLENSGVPYNIIRPNWFLQNFHTFWIQGILSEGKILLPAGKAKVSFIDTRDISAVAAKLLLDDRLKNQAFDLTGPEAVDHDAVAEAISRVTGKKIVYQEVSPETMRGALLGAGLPEDYADFLILILGFLRDGYNAGVTEDVGKILGRAPTGLQKYAEDYRKAWL